MMEHLNTSPLKFCFSLQPHAINPDETPRRKLLLLAHSQVSTLQLTTGRERRSRHGDHPHPVRRPAARVVLRGLRLRARKKAAHEQVYFVRGRPQRDPSASGLEEGLFGYNQVSARILFVLDIYPSCTFTLLYSYHAGVPAGGLYSSAHHRRLAPRRRPQQDRSRRAFLLCRRTSRRLRRRMAPRRLPPGPRVDT